MSGGIVDPVHRSESVADGAKIDAERKHLREVIDYGARLVERWVGAITVDYTEACLCVLTGQTLAMADAIEVLLGAGTTAAARVNARALFEAQLYAQWILAKDTDHRALCWWAHVKRRERANVATLLPSTVEGQEVSRLFAAAHLSTTGLHDSAKQSLAQAELARLDQRAKVAPWSSIKVTKEWFQGAGVQNIRVLAADAGQEHLYVCFYKPLCRDVHSSNPERWLALGKTPGHVEPIRTLRGLRPLLHFVIPLLYGLFRTLTDRYLASEAGALKQQIAAWPRLTAIREPSYSDGVGVAEA